MARAPFQVLILPYYRIDENIEYAIFRRTESSGGYWQGLAGGGEDEETPLDAVRREAQEEAGIHVESRYVVLDAITKVPVEGVVGTLLWGEDVLVIPEYCFGVEVANKQITLSREHAEYRWVQYDVATELLHWDSNRIALWELNHRLLR